MPISVTYAGSDRSGRRRRRSPAGFPWLRTSLGAAWVAARRSIAVALVMAVTTTALLVWQLHGLLAAERCGVLYTLTRDPLALVSVPVLDGVGAGIFGVVSVLIVADLTQGTGRFNLVLGAIGTATGLGASLSHLISGFIVQHAGYNAAFLALTVVATAALACFWIAMPETGNALPARAELRPQGHPGTSPVTSA